MSVIQISANRTVIVVSKGTGGTVARLAGRTVGSLAAMTVGLLRGI